MELYRQLVESLSQKEVTLVAVSKTKPNSAISDLYEKGQRIFGENKVQEMCTKYESLPKDIEWHLIGHLQSNKVKYIAPFVSLIHSVDSLKLAKEINKQALKNDRTIDVLLQVKIAEEDSKFGINEKNVFDLMEEVSRLPNVHVKGLMGMATFSTNNLHIQKEFESLKGVYDQIKERYDSVETLSMGMSGDYLLAIDCGSNMVRIGSLLFGARN